MKKPLLHALLWFGIAAVLAAAFLTGCSHGSSTVKGNAECARDMNCYASIPAIPDGWHEAQLAARDKLRADVDAGRVKIIYTGMDWNTLPRIEWRACPWFVKNADCDPTGTGCRDGKGVCAAGETADKGNVIIISTFQTERTLPLVAHETRNAFLVRGGRKDLAY